ncbi:hypothetical protein H9P43_003477 [Blastocladiella emersonii ATCC 22665]|nr:hypothetical protein H9P43_003477 [Blastocladiella emersonii ATCC 22665]
MLGRPAPSASDSPTPQQPAAAELAGNKAAAHRVRDSLVDAWDSATATTATTASIDGTAASGSDSPLALKPLASAVVGSDLSLGSAASDALSASDHSQHSTASAGSSSNNRRRPTGSGNDDRYRAPSGNTSSSGLPPSSAMAWADIASAPATPFLDARARRLAQLLDYQHDPYSAYLLSQQQQQQSSGPGSGAGSGQYNPHHHSHHHQQQQNQNHYTAGSDVYGTSAPGSGMSAFLAAEYASGGLRSRHGSASAHASTAASPELLRQARLDSQQYPYGSSAFSSNAGSLSTSPRSPTFLMSAIGSEDSSFRAPGRAPAPPRSTNPLGYSSTASSAGPSRSSSHYSLASTSLPTSPNVSSSIGSRGGHGSGGPGAVGHHHHAYASGGSRSRGGSASLYSEADDYMYGTSPSDAAAAYYGLATSVPLGLAGPGSLGHVVEETDDEVARHYSPAAEHESSPAAARRSPREEDLAASVDRLSLSASGTPVPATAAESGLNAAASESDSVKSLASSATANNGAAQAPEAGTGSPARSASSSAGSASPAPQTAEASTNTKVHPPPSSSAGPASPVARVRDYPVVPPASIPPPPAPPGSGYGQYGNNGNGNSHHHHVLNAYAQPFVSNATTQQQRYNTGGSAAASWEPVARGLAAAAAAADPEYSHHHHHQHHLDMSRGATPPPHAPVNVQLHQPPKHIYVSDLPPIVDEIALRKAFRRFGRIDDIRVSKAKAATAHVGRVAYVKFTFAESVAKAIEADGQIVISGKRIKVAATDPTENPTRKLFFANVWDIVEQDLRPVCEEYGEVTQVDVVADRGMMYVHFVNLEDSVKAHRALQGLTINNRYVRVEFGQSTANYELNHGGGGNAGGQSHHHGGYRKPYFAGPAGGSQQDMYGGSGHSSTAPSVAGGGGYASNTSSGYGGPSRSFGQHHKRSSTGPWSAQRSRATTVETSPATTSLGDAGFSSQAHSRLTSHDAPMFDLIAANNAAATGARPSGWHEDVLAQLAAAEAAQYHDQQQHRRGMSSASARNGASMPGSPPAAPPLEGLFAGSVDPVSAAAAAVAAAAAMAGGGNQHLLPPPPPPHMLPPFPPHHPLAGVPPAQIQHLAMMHFQAQAAAAAAAAAMAHAHHQQQQHSGGAGGDSHPGSRTNSAAGTPHAGMMMPPMHGFPHHHHPHHMAPPIGPPPPHMMFHSHGHGQQHMPPPPHMHMTPPPHMQQQMQRGAPSVQQVKGPRAPVAQDKAEAETTAAAERGSPVSSSSAAKSSPTPTPTPAGEVAAAI